MQFRTREYALAVGLVLGCLNAPALAQLPPPPPPPATLWSFLGIPQGMRASRDNTLNSRGNFPGLERKPPLKPIADPKNLQSDNPAIKKAAEVKQAEDLKPQKIKAIKYQTVGSLRARALRGAKSPSVGALRVATSANAAIASGAVGAGTGAE